MTQERNEARRRRVTFTRPVVLCLCETVFALRRRRSHEFCNKRNPGNELRDDARNLRQASGDLALLMAKGWCGVHQLPSRSLSYLCVSYLFISFICLFS